MRIQWVIKKKNKITHRDSSNCLELERGDVVNENGGIGNENMNQGVSNKVNKQGLALDIEFEGDVKEEEYSKVIIKVTIELII